jgi:hypothetical protein
VFLARLEIRYRDLFEISEFLAGFGSLRVRFRVVRNKLTATVHFDLGAGIISYGAKGSGTSPCTAHALAVMAIDPLASGTRRSVQGIADTIALFFVQRRKVGGSGALLTEEWKPIVVEVAKDRRRCRWIEPKPTSNRLARNKSFQGIQAGIGEIAPPRSRAESSGFNSTATSQKGRIICMPPA